MKQSKNILVHINQARYIACQYRLMADKCQQQIDAISRKRHSNNTQLQIDRINKSWELSQLKDRYNAKAERVWGLVTDFQGKYINWKNNHTIDGLEYCGILALIDGSFAHSSYSQYAI